MKLLRSIFYFTVPAVVLVACATGKASNKGALSERLLTDTAGWVIDTLSADMIHYQYTAWYAPQKAPQVVNVLEFDPASKDKRVILGFDAALDSLSSVCQEYPDIVAGINGTYFDKPGGRSYNFVKVDGKVLSQVEVADTSMYFWKSQGSFYLSGDGKASHIEYTDVKKLQNSGEANILTGSPVLIYNYQPVGMQFVKSPDSVVNKLPYEHPDRHQGVRHPRTAIAIAKNHHLLLITVDGRHKQAAGMSARELTEFIAHYFRPTSALNLDGGGSTTLWINGAGSNGVVNYPSDNKKFDHYGQRPAESFILIQKIKP